MLKKWIKLFCISAIVLIASNIGLVLLSNVILLTFCNIIFGSDNGLYACNTIIRILLPIILATVIFVINAKDTTSKREYLEAMSKDEYRIKEDFVRVIKDKDLWAELVIFTILLLVMLLISEKPVWMFPLSIPVFAVVNLIIRICMHKFWVNSKIHTAT